MIKYESNRQEILPTVLGGGSSDVVECFVIVWWQRTETSILQYVHAICTEEKGMYWRCSRVHRQLEKGALE